MKANATPVDVRLPDGVLDHPPTRARALEARLVTIMAEFQLAGYARVFTPTFELLDVLEPALPDITRRSVFRMVDPASGEVVVLRPDFTAQVARMVGARLGETMRPLRLCYEGRVARARDPSGRDLRSRDLSQAGAELFGRGDVAADVEILTLALDTFRRLKRPLTITIGHAALVDALLPNDHDTPAIRAALAVKDLAAVRRLAPAVAPLLDLYGDKKVLGEAKKVLANAPAEVGAALERIETLAESVEAIAHDAVLRFDLGEQRSLGYYTGFFFHGYVDGAPDAVVSGGRYDRLLGCFGADEPAVGFAIDVGTLPADPIDHPPDGVVVACDDPRSPDVRALLESHRQAGERACAAPRADAERYRIAHGFREVIEVEPRPRL